MLLLPPTLISDARISPPAACASYSPLHHAAPAHAPAPLAVVINQPLHYHHHHHQAKVRFQTCLLQWILLCEDPDNAISIYDREAELWTVMITKITSVHCPVVFIKEDIMNLEFYLSYDILSWTLNAKSQSGIKVATQVPMTFFYEWCLLKY